MASAMKTCRVCGQEYEACRSARHEAGAFRWQDVACSPECGATYLQRIMESRGQIEPQKKSKRKKIVDEPVAEVESSIRVEEPIEAQCASDDVLYAIACEGIAPAADISE